MQIKAAVVHEKTKLFQNGKPVSMSFGQSSFATHSVINQKSAVKVDADVDLALVAPMGCGIQTGAGAVLNTLRPAMNSSIAVFGCGAVGMSAIMASKVAHCDKIIAVVGNPKSLELAKELGATHTINRKEVADVPAAIAEITGNSGADKRFHKLTVQGKTGRYVLTFPASGTR